MTDLTSKQERAVVMIADLELRGEPITRYLKTPYSCPGCGYVAGQGGQPRDARKAALDKHLLACEDYRSDIRHPFICAFSTYYSKWSKDPAFVRAVEDQMEKIRADSIDHAVAMLQNATADAVQVLVRQLSSAANDRDRRLAAVAILDRADFSTASKHETRLPDEVVAIADAIYGQPEAEEDGDDDLE